MTTTKYLITGAQAKATVEYDETGLLCSIQFPEGQDQARAWFLRSVPVKHSDLPAFMETYAAKLRLTPIPPDLSFNAFYNAYAYKVGRKERAVKLWTALTEAERTACLRAIPRYNAWLAQRPSTERLYPETFLSQRRWENEYRV